jgi:hypothetical protein
VDSTWKSSAYKIWNFINAIRIDDDINDFFLRNAIQKVSGDRTFIRYADDDLFSIGMNQIGTLSC